MACYYERERRLYKNLSIIAARHAHVVCRTFSEGGKIEPTEDFPYWTQEERNEAKLARLRAAMDALTR